MCFREVVLDTYRAPWAPPGSRWSCCHCPSGRRTPQHPLLSGWRSAGFPRQSQQNAHDWNKIDTRRWGCVEMLRCLFLSGNVLVLRILEPGTVMLNRDGIKNRIQYGFISCGFSFMAWLHWKQLSCSGITREKQTKCSWFLPNDSETGMRQKRSELM